MPPNSPTVSTATASDTTAFGGCSTTTHTPVTRAAHLLMPDRDPIAIPLARPAPGIIPEGLVDHTEAMAWYAAEQPILLAAIELAADLGLDSHVWQLAWTLDTFLYRQHWQNLTVAWQAALAAAARLAEPAAEAYAHRSLAHVATRLGRDQDAYAHDERALDLYTRAGDRAGQAYIHQLLAMLWEQRHCPDRSLGHAQQSLLLYQAAGHRRGQAAALNLIGWYHGQLGQHEQALASCRQARALHHQLGARDGEAHTWDSLGYAYHVGRQPEAAVDCYRRAIDLFRDLGDRYQEAATATRLGDTLHAAGDPAAAGTAWKSALNILVGLGHPDADSLRERLDRLGFT